MATKKETAAEAIREADVELREGVLLVVLLPALASGLALGLAHEGTFFTGFSSFFEYAGLAGHS